MNLQITQRTATSIYDETGAIVGEQIASISYNVTDDENKKIGSARMDATGFSFNINGGSGSNLAMWEKNVNAAIVALNLETV